ncbi:probably inactive leucine-rich repeat receptor-like protein kinase [Tanacetum coccineum]
MELDNIRIIVTCVLILAFINVVQSDINCLKAFKKSMEDPQKVLSSWGFDNNPEGNVCGYYGVACWSGRPDKVSSILLPDKGLKGVLPYELESCSWMTELDLSGNRLYGTLPTNISKVLPFVTTLYLSSNSFSGPIPVNLANCSYLNYLRLDSNRFTGQIPIELGGLSRIKDFSVANNMLSGQVPNINVSADSYAGNPGLCGGPLSPCQEITVKYHKKPRSGVLIGAAIGVAAFAALVLVVGMRVMCKVVRKRKEDDLEGNNWAKSIKGANTIKLSMFENPVSKMRLSDLLKATQNFSKENIIGSGRTGCLYKAVLEDGKSLMLKRLQDTQHSEREFASEMATLGKVKHRNLVPFLGFCIAKKERLLVYKYMENGNLHDKLHPIGDDPIHLDWPSRLKIGIGAAKGFSWLHHSCKPHILHRNISSKCILLDENFDPRISDFVLARLMNPIDTHLSTFINGEFGDLGEKPTHVAKAPEKFKGGLVEWVIQLSAESRLPDTIDESLVEKRYNSELLQAIGEHYHFSTDDEILMMSNDNGNADQIELIVARDGLNKH